MDKSRDMDLVRDLLLQIEGGRTQFTTRSSEESVILGISDEEAPQSPEEARKLAEHLALIEGKRLIEIKFRAISGEVWVERLTWEGHDFLDTIRDDEVWRRTKAGASKVGGWSLDLIKDIAIASAKQYAKERLGLDLS